MVGSDIDYQYEGAPDPNDARFDRGTYELVISDFVVSDFIFRSVELLLS